MSVQQHYPDLDRVDIIGDVHGCFEELLELLEKIGFRDHDGVARSDYDRQLVFLGDLGDRGPHSLYTITYVMNLLRENNVLSVLGNHDWKLARYLNGRNVQQSHGFERTAREVDAGDEDTKNSLRDQLMDLPLFMTFNDGKLVVSHAGVPVRYLDRSSQNRKHFMQCLFGQLDPNQRFLDNGMPNRIYEWTDQYDGDRMCVFGHTPVTEVEQRHNTYNIDTSCAFSGKLTCLRYDNGSVELVDVPAKATYCQR